jgi:hypothetical protein
MNQAEHAVPVLHTRYLSKRQQKTCNRNPTYRARVAELHNIRNELHKLRDLLAVTETGKLAPSPRNSLKKKMGCCNSRDSKLVLSPQDNSQELKTGLEVVDAVAERVRTDYQVQEKHMLEWDDECAALAESLLAKPKV